MQHASQLTNYRAGNYPGSLEKRRNTVAQSAHAKPQGRERGQQAGTFLHPSLWRVSNWRNTPLRFETTHQLLTQRSAWLEQALAELHGIDDEIAEEGLPEISKAVMDEARRILYRLGHAPIVPMVYSTEDGEIAIDFRSSTGGRQAVLIELGDDGGGACFAFIDGRGRRARYSDSSDLPDAFVRAQLSALTKSVKHHIRAPKPPRT